MRSRWWGALVGALALLLTACLDDPSVRCADGTVCPEGTTCRAIVGTTHCVTPAQIAECDGGGDGASCTLTGGSAGVCNQGVCVRPGCGDGFLSAGEKCDGTLTGTAVCENNGYYGGTLGCTDECEYDFTDCVGRCGDGEVNGDEQCDGAALGGADCSDGGFYAPQGLGCTGNCRFDFGGCSGGRCGDGVVNGSESCDPMAPLPATHDRCDDLAFGFYGTEAVTCSLLCQYDTAACTGGRCGDDVKNGGEECDGGDVANQSCMALGYYGGNLSCTPTCFFDLDECAASGRCGDGIWRDGPEECDPGDPGGGVPPDFGGRSCRSPSVHPDGLPRYVGDLSCRSDCTIDAMDCSQRCGDGFISGPESCDTGAMSAPDDTDDDRYIGDATCRSFGYQFGDLKCTQVCTEIDLTGCSGRCGDGVLQGDEACDGATHAVFQASCGAIGDHGAMGCDSYCQLDTRACESSDWDVANVSVGPGLMIGRVDAMWAAGGGVAWAIAGPPAGSPRGVIRTAGDGWHIVAIPATTPTALFGAGATVWFGDDTATVSEWNGTAVTSRGQPGGASPGSSIKHLWGSATQLYAVVDRVGTDIDELWRATGATTWVRETLPGGARAIRAVRGVASGHVMVVATTTADPIFAERSPAGAWTTATLPTGTYHALWAQSVNHVWVAGGTDATIGAGDPVFAERRNSGAWQAIALEDAAPGSIDGTVLGIGGDSDNLWFAGVTAGRSWLTQFRGEGTLLAVRQVIPFGAFTGLADSGRGDLWAFGDGSLITHRDGAGLVTPQVPGSTGDANALVARLPRSNVRSVAVTSTAAWFAVPPDPDSLPVVPIQLLKHDPDQPLDTRWSVQPLFGSPLEIYAVAARTANDVWAFGVPSTAQRWNGSSWSSATPPVAGQAVRATATIGGVLYATTSTPGVWAHTGTGGWQFATAPIANGLLAGTAANDLWLGENALYHWNGTAWTSSPLPTGVGTLTALWSASADDLWAAGTNQGTGFGGVLMHKGPRDAALTVVPGLIIPGLINDLWGSGPADLWAVGGNNFIGHYDGQRWVPVDPATPFPTPRNFQSVDGSSRDRVWAVGDDGTLLRLTAALPPSASPPCADAIPVYCSGMAPPGGTAKLYGTIPVGGRAVYRLDPPFEATVDLVVRTNLSAGAITARRLNSNDEGACHTVAASVTSSLPDVPLSLPMSAPAAGHEPVYLELTASGQSAPLGYQLDFTCAPTP